MVTATSRKQPSSKTKRNAKASSAGMPGAKTARRGKSTGARQSNETSGAAATMQTLWAGARTPWAMRISGQAKRAMTFQVRPGA